MTKREFADSADAALRATGADFERHGNDTFVVVLPGERKLRTTTMLTASVHGLRIEAFVCRHPDENEAGVHSFLLRRNQKLYGVAYTIDQMRDIYLVGRMSAAAVTADELDRIFGQILEAVDSDFNVLLELGFAESIRREWKWRVSRGESLRNLQAFTHLVGEANTPAQG